MLTIGCHLSSAKGYRQMARDAAKIDANTFQFFTRNPRGGKAKDIDPEDVQAFRDEASDAGIEVLLAHAPYTLNPASAKPETREFAREVMADDLLRMENTPGQLYNMHPGCHVGQGSETGIQLIAEAIDEVLDNTERTLGHPPTTMVLLETMAGKGSEVGGRFEEIAEIMNVSKHGAELGVCLDTCHVWEAGYDIVNDLDGVLTQFDEIVGLDRLHAIHLNDSKNPIGAHKDRHEKIGVGQIGFDALSTVTKHPKLKHLPFFLETPQDDLSGWGDEIKALREAWN